MNRDTAYLGYRPYKPDGLNGQVVSAIVFCDGNTEERVIALVDQTPDTDWLINGCAAFHKIPVKNFEEKK
jgi:hypothetical protein